MAPDYLAQTLVIDYPPLFDEISAAFPVKGRTVIYSWGNRIYNPSKIIVTPELLAHERVHGMRQGENEQSIIDWWKRYIDDEQFRLSEELPAHQAEYQWLVDNANRKHRRGALSSVATKLSSPLYGGMLSHKQAKEFILN